MQTQDQKLPLWEQEELQQYRNFTQSMNAVMFILDSSSFRVEWLSLDTNLLDLINIKEKDIKTIKRKLSQYLVKSPDLLKSLVHSMEKTSKDNISKWSGIYQIRANENMNHWIIYTASYLQTKSKTDNNKVAIFAFIFEQFQAFFVKI